MADPKRTKFEIERDQVEIAKLYLQGFTQAQIPEELQKITKAKYLISQPMIHNDLKKIKRKWAEQKIENFNELVNIQHTKINMLESEFWNSLDRHKEYKLPNPRFLEGILKCIDQRCKLFGLYFDSRKKSHHFKMKNIQESIKHSTRRDLRTFIIKGFRYKRHQTAKIAGKFWKIEKS